MTDEDEDFYKIPDDIREKAEKDAKAGLHIRVGPDELIAMIDEADKALNGDSNDDEHDALYKIRESLSGIFENGARE